MEIDEKKWKLALTNIIEDFAEDRELTFGQMFTFFCEMVCVHLQEDADEEDARELCKLLYELMVRFIELRKEGHEID